MAELKRWAKKDVAVSKNKKVRLEKRALASLEGAGAAGRSASTLQGELVRIAGKLTDQAFRNGNMNWDADHERMWRFIGEEITRDSVFSPEDRTFIHEKIEQIIRDQECPNLNGDSSPYYAISQKVVDWCIAHPTPIPHSEDPTLQR